jgi:transposase, IS5 family
MVASYVQRAKESIAILNGIGNGSVARIMTIENYVVHAQRQIGQISRRVLDGETIPHNEKVFSIFEVDTEWIGKDKAGVPQELGLGGLCFRGSIWLYPSSSCHGKAK